MKRLLLLAMLAGTPFLGACVNPYGGQLMHMTTNPQQMKKSYLVGQMIYYCSDMKSCRGIGAGPFMVTKQDDVSITLKSGKRLLYTDIYSLYHPVSGADKVKANLEGGLLVPAEIACAAVSNTCWR